MKKFLILLLIVSGCMCTTESGTIETLHKAGFTDVQTDGYAFFACSEDDTFATRFVATNPAGQRVGGAVCCGLMKNCTIRF